MPTASVLAGVAPPLKPREQRAPGHRQGCRPPSTTSKPAASHDAPDKLTLSAAGGEFRGRDEGSVVKDTEKKDAAARVAELTRNVEEAEASCRRAPPTASTGSGDAGPGRTGCRAVPRRYRHRRVGGRRRGADAGRRCQPASAAGHRVRAPASAVDAAPAPAGRARTCSTNWMENPLLPLGGVAGGRPWPASVGTALHARTEPGRAARPTPAST